MRKISRFLSGAMAILMTASTFAACGNTPGTDGASPAGESTTAPAAQPAAPAASGETIEVAFWTAPESYNYDFWNGYAEQFNASGAQLEGKSIKVNVQQMPAQPSSEAGIQNSIATGTVPVLSENINRSFAAVLANSDVVRDLSGESWFKDMVSERQIGDVLNGWEVNGAQYVLPLYVNAIGYYWNTNALRALGVDKVPTTVEEFNGLLATYVADKSKLSDLGVSHFMYRYELSRPDAWWERWFDFEAQYNAFSGGTPMVDGNALTMDKAATQKTMELLGGIGSEMLLGEISGIWQETQVPVVMGIACPWDIQPNKAAGKIYGMDGDYVFGPMLVEKAGDTPYTFADSKGIVFYKHDSISEEQYQGGVEFLKYVFLGDGKDTVDIGWLEATGMLPVRGDLATNSNLQSYFDANPELKDVAAFVPYGIPCMDHPEMEAMLIAMGEQGLTPYFTGEAASATPGSAPDAATATENMAAAMTAAGSLG